MEEKCNTVIDQFYKIMNFHKGTAYRDGIGIEYGRQVIQPAGSSYNCTLFTENYSHVHDVTCTRLISRRIFSICMNLLRWKTIECFE